MHSSRRLLYRLLPPFVRPIGVKDPAHEYVSSSVVQRRAADPSYAPPGLLAHLAGAPKVMDVD
jgi:hypothetical protein